MPKLSKADQAAKISANEARRRKEVALASTRELQLATLQGKLLSRDSVVRVWSEAYTRLRDRLLSIPDRCAVELATCRDEAQARRIVRNEIEEALKALAKNRSSYDSGETKKMGSVTRLTLRHSGLDFRISPCMRVEADVM